MAALIAGTDSATRRALPAGVADVLSELVDMAASSDNERSIAAADALRALLAEQAAGNGASASTELAGVEALVLSVTNYTGDPRKRAAAIHKILRCDDAVERVKLAQMHMAFISGTDRSSGGGSGGTSRRRGGKGGARRQ
jgi:hypothetical protein